MSRILTAYLFVAMCTGAGAQTANLAPAATKLAVVMPFENQSRAPGLDWVGESFPETIGPRLAQAGLLVIERKDRQYAFERAGLPVGTRVSRATLFRVAEEMDADYAILGSYTFDGRTFTARAQLMDLKRLKLLPQTVESGALIQLLEIQNALAWDLLRQLELVPNSPKNGFVNAAAGVRLDALENYVRGVIATDRTETLKFLREAVRISPGYAEAQFELGKALFEAKDNEQSITALAKVPRESLLYGQAQFFAGLANYYIGKYEAAENAFKAVAERVPLIEVFNNVGVMAARRGKDGREYFSRAALADTRDADYRFNLAVTMYRAGDLSGAQRQLKDAIALRPQDAEAKALLEQVSAGAPFPTTKPPLERVKKNYDESSYRQLASEIATMREMRLAALPAIEHAAEHVKTGNGLYADGNGTAAESEFREAILLDPTNAGAHVGLAKVLEAEDQLAEARGEANAANRLRVTADAFLVLARIDLKQSKGESAADNVARALRMEPENTDAAALKLEIDKRKTGSQE